MFVNLVAMRQCMSKHYNTPPCLVNQPNLDVLYRSNFLFHAAHNGILNLKISLKVTNIWLFPCSLMVISGLAMEAIQSGKLLWKIRPKIHKFFGSKVGYHVMSMICKKCFQGICSSLFSTKAGPSMP